MKIKKVNKKKVNLKRNLLSAFLPLLALGVYYVYDLNENSQPELSVKESELVDIKYDVNLYPNNIVVLDGSANITNKEKEDVKERIKKVKLTIDSDDKGENKHEVIVDKSWQEYSELDNLGRTKEARAYVTFDGVYNHSKKVTKRPDFSSTTHVSGEFSDGEYDETSGVWRSSNPKKYRNNKIVNQGGYRGYLYNKSHSIAWSLGGDMETHNVTLGTRSQNVGKNDGLGGMAYAETLIRDSINKDNKKTYYYSVKPLYKGKELVPRGSLQRVYSVHDNGKTMDFSVWAFNVQNGFEIDYNTGKWEIAK